MDEIQTLNISHYATISATPHLHYRLSSAVRSRGQVISYILLYSPFVWQSLLNKYLPTKGYDKCISDAMVGRLMVKYPFDTHTREFRRRVPKLILLTNNSLISTLEFIFLVRLSHASTTTTKKRRIRQRPTRQSASNPLRSTLH